MSQSAYSVGTWDTDEQAYTVQVGMSGPSINISLAQLRCRMKELKALGYSCHRLRDSDGDHDDNDWSVLIERTDGRTDAEIIEGWRR